MERERGMGRLGACLVGALAWWLAVHGRTITGSKKGKHARGEGNGGGG